MTDEMQRKQEKPRADWQLLKDLVETHEDSAFELRGGMQVVDSGNRRLMMRANDRDHDSAMERLKLRLKISTAVA